MTARAVDLEKLRVALRRLSRHELLMICERGIELVPRARLAALVGDVVRLDELTKTKAGAVPLLAEVRKFHEASMRGDYYESFAVNSKNFMDLSEGTEAFMADFDRLVGKCIRAVDAHEPRAPLRESFELLFGLLRYIDECNDDITAARRVASAEQRRPCTDCDGKIWIGRGTTQTAGTARDQSRAERGRRDPTRKPMSCTVPSRGMAAALQGASYWTTSSP